MPATATLERCPACGAKIARPELSICSYCATPLGLGQSAVAEPTEVMQRLERMRDHRDHAPAMAWDPPDELEDPRVRPLRARASTLLLLGGVTLAGALVRGVLPGGLESSLARTLVVAAAILVGLGLSLRAVAASILRKARSFPMLKRPCLVRDRGSAMGEGGAGRTIYVFDLEFADGSAGTFRYPGRGASHDPMTKGATGVAYTRRDQLLAFKQIRV